MSLPLRRASRRGFTLIELLTVIGIIVILMGLLVPAVVVARNYAKRVKASTLVDNVASAINQYRGMNGVYPERLNVRATPDMGDPVAWTLALNSATSLASGDEAYAKYFKPGASVVLSASISDGDWQAVNAVLAYHLGSFATDYVNASTGLLLDAWGKPLRYRPSKFHPFNSGSAATGATRIDSDTPPNPDSFQLWSMGADTVDGYGESGDDLPNWKKN